MSCGGFDPGCRRCRLSEGRTQVVPGVGPCDARIVFIGEAPGRDEDAKGEPFVGRSGRMLDEAFEAAGATRSQVYITNVVKCRPPGNRRPKPDEVEACRAHIRQEMDRLRPKVVCALGYTVARSMFGSEGKMADLAGSRWETEVLGHRVIAYIAYHPAACLYNRKNVGSFKRTIEACLAEARLE